MMQTIRVGNAPCSWGTLEFEGMGGKGIGAAQMLDELAQTGYEGTELGDWGFMPTRPADLHAELSKRELSLLGAFVPVGLKNSAAHQPGLQAALKTAQLLADVRELARSETAPFLVLSDENGADSVRTQNAGRVTPEMSLTEEQWKTFAEGANRIAQEVKERTGLRTVFHHHCSGYIETAAEIERLLHMTDPDLLGLVFDTGHYVYGAGRYTREVAVEGLDRFSERTWYIHLKDCDPSVARQSSEQNWDYFTAVRKGVFCELGRGCVDFPAVKAWLQARGYQGWVLVEQDILPGLGQPKESAQRNREYLRSIGL